MSESRLNDQSRKAAASRSKVFALRNGRPASSKARATKEPAAAAHTPAQPAPSPARATATATATEPSYRERAAEARRQAADYLQRLRQERLDRHQKPVTPAPTPASAQPDRPAVPNFADEFPPGFRAEATVPAASARASKSADPVRSMRIEDVPAFGPALKRKLAAIGIFTLEDLSRHPEADLRQGLGPAARVVPAAQLIQFARTVCRGT